MARFLGSVLSGWPVVFGGLLVGLGLPSGVECRFDGLPWSGRAELVVVAVVLPMLVVLARGWLWRRWVVVGVGVLVVLKVVMGIWAPRSGWGVWVGVKGGGWERHWESLWEGGMSARLVHHWACWRDFPLEWLNRYSSARRRDLELWMRVEGWARLGRGEGIGVLARGMKEVRGWVEEGGRRWPLRIVEDWSPVPDGLTPVGPGAVHVVVEARFTPGPGLERCPVVAGRGGRFMPAPGRGVLWMGERGARQGPWAYRIWWTLGRVVEGLVVLLIGGWGIWAIKRLVAEGVLTWGGIGIGGVCLCGVVGAAWAASRGLPGPWDLGGPRMVRIFVPMWVGWLVKWGVWGGGMWVVWRGFKDGLGPGRRIFALLGSIILAFYLSQWWDEARRFLLFRTGEDWRAYQNFARDIVVGGDWLHSRIGPYQFQPLYRYLTGALHALFGQSTLAQRLGDVWAVVGMGALVGEIGVGLGLGGGLAALAGVMEIALSLEGRFMYLIGHLLQEYVAAFFVVLCGWWWARRKTLAGASVVGVVGSWLRMDHLGVIGACGLLGAGGVGWRGLWEWVRANWVRLAVFWGVLGVGLGMVAFRNWWVGGVFNIYHPAKLHLQQSRSLVEALGCVGVILDGDPSRWLPRVVLWVGSIGGIIGALAGGGTRGYPSALALVLVGALMPYFFFRFWAYPPRFSVHVLPWAVLSCVCLGRAVYERLAVKARGVKGEGPAGQGRRLSLWR